MAKVIMIFEDLPGGEVDINVEFDPILGKLGKQTPAQLLVKYMLVDAAEKKPCKILNIERE